MMYSAFRKYSDPFTFCHVIVFPLTNLWSTHLNYKVKTRKILFLNLTLYSVLKAPSQRLQTLYSVLKAPLAASSAFLSMTRLALQT